MTPSANKAGVANILLVDDDATFRTAVSLFLDCYPDEWTYRVAGTVKEAVALLASQDFDLAILDVHLPDGNAADIVRNAGTVPCLICTEDQQMPTYNQLLADSSIAQNIVNYIVKPLQQSVIWTIRSAIRFGQERDLRNRQVAAATASYEEERRQIGQNLHDSMGAFLAQLSWIFSRIDGAMGNSGIDKELAATVQAICKEGKQLVEGAHREVSEAVTQLRPEAVNVAGLRTAIEYMLEQWRMTAPTVKFEYACNVDLEQIDSRRSGTIYRLVQEGLTNAMRHTDPTHIAVAMNARNDQLILTIKSKGRVLVEKDTYKLTVLRERTSSLGGVLQFVIDPACQESSLAITLPMA